MTRDATMMVAEQFAKIGLLIPSGLFGQSILDAVIYELIVRHRANSVNFDLDHVVRTCRGISVLDIVE
jgi:hypothetical protein